MRWIKTGKTVSAEGTTITYQEDKGDLVIESRKRHIQHANGIGTWDYTSYWLLQGNKEIKELPYMLNSSALAIGRTIVALMENYQTKGGKVDFDKIFSLLG